MHVLRLQAVPLGIRHAFTNGVMATCDCPSDLVHHPAYRSLGRPGLRADSPRFPAFSREEKSRSFASDDRQGVEAGDLFRESLIASGKSRRRNPWATAGAVAFQLLLLLAIVVIPLFHTDPMPKRETLTMLYLQPPAAAVASPRKLQAPKSASTYTPASTTPVYETQEAPSSPAGTTAGTLGGVSAGVLSEAPRSTLSAPVLAAKTPESAPVKRVRVAARVAEANLIHDVAPQYPPDAGRARIEGTVVLMAVIGKDGNVEDVRVESGLPMLAQAAVDAVKQWRYRPYMLNGEPVEVDSRITINFTLSRG